MSDKKAIDLSSLAYDHELKKDNETNKPSTAGTYEFRGGGNRSGEPRGDRGKYAKEQAEEASNMSWNRMGRSAGPGPSKTENADSGAYVAPGRSSRQTATFTRGGGDKKDFSGPRGAPELRSVAAGAEASGMNWTRGGAAAAPTTKKQVGTTFADRAGAAAEQSAAPPAARTAPVAITEVAPTAIPVATAPKVQCLPKATKMDVNFDAQELDNFIVIAAKLLTEGPQVWESEKALDVLSTKKLHGAGLDAAWILAGCQVMASSNAPDVTKFMENLKFLLQAIEPARVQTSDQLMSALMLCAHSVHSFTKGMYPASDQDAFGVFIQSLANAGQLSESSWNDSVDKVTNMKAFHGKTRVMRAKVNFA